MQATGDAKARKSDKAPKKGHDEAAPAADGPSVAAHPRASLHVARAKGWGGLIGFLLGGYMALPTNTLAVVGLRALMAGVACYLAAWAGAVFVWRHLVMLQIAGARHRTHPRLGGGGTSASASSNPAHQRENVRVAVERPVVAYVGAKRSRVQTFTIDISAGGLLVGGLDMLDKGEPFEFQLTHATGAAPVTGIGSVVRTDPQGRCAVAIQSISDHDQRRLIAFIFEQQRSQLEGAAQR
jgi:hypothetical protein